MTKYILWATALILLSGCAGKTTDPREGGLFSYNPNAYEKRLSNRENKLHAIQRDTSIQRKKNKRLEQKYRTEKSKMK